MKRTKETTTGLTQAHGALRVLFDLVQANLNGPVFAMGSRQREREAFGESERALKGRVSSRPLLRSSSSSGGEKKQPPGTTLRTHLSAQKDFAIAPGDVGSSSGGSGIAAAAGGGEPAAAALSLSAAGSSSLSGFLAVVAVAVAAAASSAAVAGAAAPLSSSFPGSIASMLCRRCRRFDL